jgi:tetratricopeptide (TPR) repeat protein
MADGAQVWGGPDSPYAYRAFISYSHRDKAFAMRLHRALENYRIPPKLVGTETAVGVVPKRLTPIFRDREELPASPDLGGELSRAIRGSMFLIVICSPGAAKSKWVEQEIIQFKRAHGESRVLALVTEGTPNGTDTPGREDEECFPWPLRYRLGPDGDVSDVRAEPIAADLRQHADGRRLAQLKLIAGLTGLKLDQLVQREAQRRMQQLSMVAAGAMGGMVITGGLALYANQQRIEANQQRIIAEKEARAARAASDYLVGTFELSNPATENPRTITALTILGRSADRARDELKGQPEIQSRLLATLGRAYNNLGLFKEARSALETSEPSLAKAGPDGADALLVLADTHFRTGALDEAMAAVDRAERLLGPDTTKHVQKRGLAAATRGRIFYRRSELDNALVWLDRGLKFLEADPEARPRDIASIYNTRGQALADEGKYKLAEASLTDALAIYRRHLGDKHLTTGRAWQALAQNAYQAGDYVKAERHMGNALRIERAVLEGNNPTLGSALSLQGQILFEQRKYAQAALPLREAVAIFQKAYGRPHFNTGIAEAFLAQIEAEQGRTDAALRTLDEAKHNYDVAYGKTHPNHGELLVFRARILAKAGRRAEAQADCVKGLDILRTTLGPDESFTKQNEAKCVALGAPARPVRTAAVKPG